jgi:hypothetical protein
MAKVKEGSKAVIHVKHTGTIAAPWQVVVHIQPTPGAKVRRVVAGRATSKQGAIDIANKVRKQAEARVETVKMHGA